jgi:hypothetical protein
MLDKLLGNLKKNLPGSLQNKKSTEESQADESVEHSDQESRESHDTSTNVASADEERKKRISMILRVFIALGIGYFVATEFLFKPEVQNEVAPVSIKKRPKKKPAAETLEGKAEQVKPGDTGPNEVQIADKKNTDFVAPVAPVEKAADISPATPAKEESKAPVENINIADKKVEEKASEEKVVGQAIDETPIVSPPADNLPQVGEVKGKETQVEKSLDSLIDSIDSKEKKKGEVKQSSNLEDKIVADDEYIPPPAYDQLGRGLVYNCKEKFWACLDRTAYVTCNKNMKWNDSHGKAAECVVQNVYNSEEDCSTIQKYNVSTNKSTDFCKP